MAVEQLLPAVIKTMPRDEFDPEYLMKFMVSINDRQFGPYAPRTLKLRDISLDIVGDDAVHHYQFVYCASGWNPRLTQLRRWRNFADLRIDASELADLACQSV